MPRNDDTFERARGRWVAILTELGIESKLLNKRNQPCPSCGGKDRFRFTDNNGDGCFICSHCGGGNGLTLLQKMFGWSVPDTFRKIDSILGSSKAVQSKPKQANSEHKQRENRKRLWNESKPLTAFDAAGRYLTSRTGIKSFPDDLRFIEKAFYRDESGDSFYACMVALVRAADDVSPSTVHRTFLSSDGNKANVESPRRMMPGSVPVGAAVRLAPFDDVLGVAEGIETALSASALFGVPVWSTISSGLLEQWKPPAGLTKVIVFGDNDLNFVGQAAAFALAKRLSSVLPCVEVALPPQIGADWNDVWVAQNQFGKAA